MSFRLIGRHLSVMLFALTLVTARVAEPLAAGSHEQSLAHDGLTRTYRIHIPPGYDGTKAVPLVLVFHGGGGTAERIEQGLGFNPLADKHGFIVVYPQGEENHWNDGRTGERFPNAGKYDDVG